MQEQTTAAAQVRLAVRTTQDVFAQNTGGIRANVFREPVGQLSQHQGQGGEGEKLVGLFLAYLRTRLSRLRGICPDTLRLHLKECEFRFNNARAGGSLSRRILAILRERPLA
ncbi:hypothetical protein [Desulfonatronum parangueonense]